MTEKKFGRGVCFGRQRRFGCGSEEEGGDRILCGLGEPVEEEGVLF